MEQSPLLKAILAAGKELGTEHNWLFDDESDQPSEGDIFAKTMLKHLEPICDLKAWKKSKIEALKAELKSLEQNEK